MVNFFGKNWIRFWVFIYSACRDVFPHNNLIKKILIPSRFLAFVTMLTPADFNSLAWKPWQQLLKMRGNIEAAA